MLNKLLKYELKGSYKFLVIFYLLAIFFATMTRIFLSIDNSIILKIIGYISSGATISMIANILINNFMRLWVRFNNNLYKDESYLTHTLPVSKHSLYLSKILNACITLLTSILIISITLFIAYYSKETFEMIKTFLSTFESGLAINLPTFIIMALTIIFLELLNLIQNGFGGIILGHKMNNMKNGYSVLFGFLYYLGTNLLTILMVFIFALFDKNLMILFKTNDMLNPSIFKTFLYLCLIIYCLTFLIGYFINIKIFKKGVNVD